MLEVAALSLCEELYKLSGWDDTHAYYDNGDDDLTFNGAQGYEGQVEEFYNHPDNSWGDIPAYELGYLLRKLPRKVDDRPTLWSTTDDGKWQIEYYLNKQLTTQADTPEDAAAKLCIKLIKQNIIKPHQTNKGAA